MTAMMHEPWYHRNDVVFNKVKLDTDVHKLIFLRVSTVSSAIKQNNYEHSTQCK